MQPSSIIPTLRYENTLVAIDWLVGVLGFQKRFIVLDKNGGIAHATLTLGAGMIMLSSASDTPFAKLMKQPNDVGGAETQSCHPVVPRPRS